MPFLPFVLLFAWQVLSKSAAFAVGWATSLFFGQVPGNKGAVLSVITVVAAAWVVLLVGFGLPLGMGYAGQQAGLLSRTFNLPAPVVWGLLAVLVLTPVLLAGMSELAEFDGRRSVGGWLRRVPMSYLATGSLGVSVLQMVVVTPFLLLARLRARRRLLEVPLVLDGESPDELSQPIIDALGSLKVGRFAQKPMTGPTSWPLRTAGFAARHLLGRVVRGDPILLEGGDLRVVVYATNIGILGPEDEAHRARAAIEKELAFSRAFLTWSTESQAFEEQLRRLYRAHRDEGGGFDGDLVRLQRKIDAAPLPSDEWNLLYRLRLQLEREAQEGDTAASNGTGSASVDERPQPPERVSG